MCLPSNDPIKAKRTMIVLLVLSIAFFVGVGVMGYFYYQKDSQYKKLTDEKKSLEDQKNKEVVDLQKQIADLNGTGKLSSESVLALQKENEQLKKDSTADKATIKDLTNQINAKKAGIAKAVAYNEFLKYLNYVIEVHGGYSGWTDAEFQTGKAKAEVTGDAAFVSTVNWAWYETSVPQVDRIIRVNKEIVSGIENALK